jgi:hypothetical protein
VAQLEEAGQNHPELADTLAPLRESARRFMLDDLDRQLRAVVVVVVARQDESGYRRNSGDETPDGEQAP